MRRSNILPQLRFHFWTVRGKFYFADSTHIALAIKNSGSSEELLKRKMGEGFKIVQELRAGNGVDVYSAAYLEAHLGPGMHQAHATSVEVSDVLQTAKELVQSMLGSLSANELQEGRKGFELKEAFAYLDELCKESSKPDVFRDSVKIQICWARLKPYVETYKLFDRYKGDKQLKKTFLDFINNQSTYDDSAK